MAHNLDIMIFKWYYEELQRITWLNMSKNNTSREDQFIDKVWWKLIRQVEITFTCANRMIETVHFTHYQCNLSILIVKSTI